jgi:hypothetical protein
MNVPILAQEDSMKQTVRRKMSLNRETVRMISDACLAGAVGGVLAAPGDRRGTGPVDSCEGCTVPTAVPTTQP